MNKHMALSASAMVAALVTTTPAQAQMPTGWLNQVDGLAIYQGSADLDNGGDFTATRTFLRGTALFKFDNGNSAGLSVNFGQFDYEFSQASTQPWNDIRDIRISTPVRLQLGERASLFAAPQVRWDYQRGADASDGVTAGLFAGASWEISDSLTLGPAFGAFSQLEESELQFFPALLVDWDISDRWNLNTGSGLGATGGPGLTLKYAYNDKLDLSLSARAESVRFRLDDVGVAPDGVGEDDSIPVVVAISYAPNPGMSFNVFAGAEFNGELSLDDANGNQISSQSYDTAPIFGGSFRIRF
ncbi:hypothetical protein ROA7450_02159 [Roseovarius albus]|uniref:Outer membrane protein beta-barrel domain-containing protein n=1 Tax=Roseovarius albus TaxID=1247867 RepID=A0A1X6Z9V2_9RHOB|nr:hypothetical protein [Roseovarius albus]SLN44613.1 hypothetical protein ROA7450_02159 [Roseovarius albus]